MERGREGGMDGEDWRGEGIGRNEEQRREGRERGWKEREKEEEVPKVQGRENRRKEQGGGVKEEGAEERRREGRDVT